MTVREDAVVGRLLDWFDEHGRHDLPWHDPGALPFEVLVAELMLQKTSAEQVLGVVEEYPKPEAIVDASREEIAEEIDPFELRKRAEYFRRASEQLVEHHGGNVLTPRTGLLDLHGVGEYTAASVLAHAHAKDAAAVDTNVARILSRVFGLDAANDPSADENWEVAEQLAPPGRCSDYVHALIDFGAAVCTATILTARTVHSRMFASIASRNANSGSSSPGFAICRRRSIIDDCARNGYI